jgi:hypothetical protein
MLHLFVRHFVSCNRSEKIYFRSPHFIILLLMVNTGIRKIWTSYYSYFIQFL